MSQSKPERALQTNLIGYWKDVHNTRAKKTHEMVSSGKPDLRVSNDELGQLDVELKVKETGLRGLVTGISKIQAITIDEMNTFGTPAVALIWDDHHKDFWLSLFSEDDRREAQPWRIIPAVVYKRAQMVVTPRSLYLAAKRLLNDHGYPSAEFLNPFNR